MLIILLSVGVLRRVPLSSDIRAGGPGAHEPTAAVTHDHRNETGTSDAGSRIGISARTENAVSQRSRPSRCTSLRRRRRRSRGSPGAIPRSLSSGSSRSRLLQGSRPTGSGSQRSSTPYSCSRSHVPGQTVRLVLEHPRRASPPTDPPPPTRDTDLLDPDTSELPNEPTDVHRAPHRLEFGVVHSGSCKLLTVTATPPLHRADARDANTHARPRATKASHGAYTQAVSTTALGSRPSRLPPPGSRPRVPTARNNGISDLHCVSYIGVSPPVSHRVRRRGVTLALPPARGRAGSLVHWR